VKQVKRLRAKVKEAQQEYYASQHSMSDGAGERKGGASAPSVAVCSWPFTGKIGDVLRASICARDARGIRSALECIDKSPLLKVIRLKNKFKAAASIVDKDGSGFVTEAELQTANKNKMDVFANLHINVLFQAEGCAPLVAEIQIHDNKLLSISKQSHKLYEIIRAKSMLAAARGRGSSGRSTMGGGAAALTISTLQTNLEKKDEEIERLKAMVARGGGAQGARSLKKGKNGGGGTGSGAKARRNAAATTIQRVERGKQAKMKVQKRKRQRRATAA
jgi:hypothetical protein